MAKNRKPRKPPPRVGRRAPPDAGWNDDAPDRGEALKQCARIKEKIEDAPEGVWARAVDFFEDVGEKVTGVAETIERTGRVTPGQQSALNNWEGGVDKWLENARDGDDEVPDDDYRKD